MMPDSSPNPETTEQSDSPERVAVFDEIKEIIEPPRAGYRRSAWAAVVGALLIIALAFTPVILPVYTSAVVAAALTLPALVMLVRGAQYEHEALTRSAARYAAFGAIIAFAAVVYLLCTTPTVTIVLYPVPTWLVSAGLLLAIASATNALFTRAQLPEREESRAIKLPVEARKIERGAAHVVAVNTLKRGSIVLVTEGEIIPVDGVVLEGSGLVNEHALTSAQTPVQKLPGSKFFAGSTVTSGRFLITVHTTGDETVLGQLQAQPIDALDTALQARVQTSVHTIGRGGSVAGMLLGSAAAVFLAPSVGVMIAGATLVSAGTNAVRASASTRYSVLDAVARSGARVRTADALMKLSSVNTVVVEKTGVLTTGIIAVEHVVSFKPYTQQQVLNLAAAVQAHSDTRLGKTIVGFSRSMGAISLQRADDVKEEEGAGIIGTVNGKEILVGTLTFARRRKVRVPKDALGSADEGKSILIVAQDKDAIGFIALSDAARDETNNAIAALLSHHHVIMLTSDHKATADAHARAVGITDVIADIAPAKKGAEIAKLRAAGKKVALVALVPRSEADVSIVLFDGRAQSPIAGADIIVRHDDLSAVASVFHALDTEKTTYERDMRRTRIISGASFLVAVVAPPVAWIVTSFRK
jgi:Cu2+-exporting ATPase